MYIPDYEFPSEQIDALALDLQTSRERVRALLATPSMQRIFFDIWGDGFEGVGTERLNPFTSEEEREMLQQNAAHDAVEKVARELRDRWNWH